MLYRVLQTRLLQEPVLAQCGGGEGGGECGGEGGGEGGVGGGD